MPVIINEMVATIRPEPKAVARDVVRRPVTAEGAADQALKDLDLAREREKRLAID